MPHAFSSVYSLALHCGLIFLKNLDELKDKKKLISKEKKIKRIK